MNPLRIAAWAVQLVCDLVAPVEKMHPWPDGEQPLIDEPPLLDGSRYITVAPDSTTTGGAVDGPASFEPMPGWFRGGFDDEESSARCGSASLAGVDPEAEGPTPGAAHTPGVGQPEVTAALMVSAALGLRKYAVCRECTAPTYWRNVADQLDPK